MTPNLTRLVYLFHKDVSDSFLDCVFEIMKRCPQHIFQVLTKRPERMAEYLALYDEGDMPHVWVGVSVENQRSADERIPILLQTPAAVRWISAEPLLEAVDLRPWMGYGRYEGNVPGHCVDIDGATWHADTEKCRTCGWGYPDDPDYPNRVPGIDWCVVGGESGPRARPMDIQWARSLRQQCAQAGVAYFMKQLSQANAPKTFRDFESFPEDLQVREYPNAKT